MSSGLRAGTEDDPDENGVKRFLRLGCAVTGNGATQLGDFRFDDVIELPQRFANRPRAGQTARAEHLQGAHCAGADGFPTNTQVGAFMEREFAMEGAVEEGIEAGG